MSTAHHKYVKMIVEGLCGFPFSWAFLFHGDDVDIPISRLGENTVLNCKLSEPDF